MYAIEKPKLAWDKGTIRTMVMRLADAPKVDTVVRHGGIRMLVLNVRSLGTDPCYVRIRLGVLGEVPT